jgi:hypothetical protein
VMTSYMMTPSTRCPSVLASVVGAHREVDGVHELSGVLQRVPRPNHSPLRSGAPVSGAG